MKNKCIFIQCISLLFLLIPTMVSSQNPGGVSGAYLWLKADSGVVKTGNNVSTWNNLISTSMVTQASKSTTSNVIYASGDINYNPSINFDGASDQKLQGQFTTAPSLPPLFFLVAKRNDTSSNCCLNPISYSPAGAAGITYGGAAVNLYSLDFSGGGCSSSQNGADKLFLIRGVYQSLSSALNGFLSINGEVKPICSGGSTSTPDGIFQIGGRTFGGIPSRIFKGKIAEVAIFNNTVTSNQIKRIESYLAIKYGITLLVNYVNPSDSSVTIYNVSSYGNDIIGIGRDSMSRLLQKQSTQGNDTTRIYLSTLASDNISNTGSFSTNNQFVMMGHNNDSLKAIYFSTEIPSSLGIYSRLRREWKITNTNFNGTYSIDIKLATNSNITPSQLRVLIDSDGNFTDATMYNPTISYSSGVITISGINTTMIPTNSTRFLTLVSLNSLTPLPVELISFNAKPINNKTVLLEWSTASEKNNDYFTIEKSQDANNWLELEKIKGAGNSTTQNNYQNIDPNPYQGISYYRLKQTDIESNSEILKIKSVKILSTNTDIKIYPNPTNEKIYVELKNIDFSSIKTYDLLGQNVTNQISISRINNDKALITIHKLTPNIYFLEVNGKAVKFEKNQE